MRPIGCSRSCAWLKPSWISFASCAILYSIITPGILASETQGYPEEEQIQAQIPGVQAQAHVLPLEIKSWKHDEEDVVASLNMGHSISGRQASTSPIPLLNNVPAQGSVLPGDTQYWVFTAEELGTVPSGVQPVLPPTSGNWTSDTQDSGQGSSGIELRKRQQPGDHLLYITLSVCTQPSPDSANAPSAPPQLILYQSGTNQNPGPSLQQTVQAEGGYLNYTDPTSGDTFFGVFAPSSSGFEGNYTYELTASVDAPYTFFQNFQSLYFVDSDSQAGLFVTSPLTGSGNGSAYNSWMSSGSPFSIFVHEQNDTQVEGIKRSWCGLVNYALVRGNVPGLEDLEVEVGMNNSLGGEEAKQVFYVQGLNSSSSYYAILGLESNYSSSGPGNVGGGGMIWQDISFSTKSDANCELVYNLSFCDAVAYAVPANPGLFPTEGSLGEGYDNNASIIFTNFANSLDQIPCNTTASAQYSLVATCDDCYNAYKAWLCAVLMPRCTDYSSTLPFLQARAVDYPFLNGTIPTPDASNGFDPTFSAENKTARAFNSSRNAMIDQYIKPGPYKEVLPCKGLCFGLVQSCPSALGFQCPQKGRGLEISYGSAGSLDGNPTCNMPGAVYGVSGARREGPGLWVALVALAVILTTSV